MTAVVLAAGLALAACSDGGDDVEAFCEDAKATGELADVFDTYDPADLERTADQFDQAAIAYEDLLDAAPDEVTDDLEVLAAFATDFRDGVRAADPRDPAGANAVALELEDRFAEVEAATLALEQYVTQECLPAPSE